VKLGKRVVSPAVLSLAVVVAAAAVWGARYDFYCRAILGGLAGIVKSISAHDSFPELTVAQSLDLGWAQSAVFHPKNSYLDYPQAKRQGVVRVGVFGESFVAGDEAAYGQDFPSLLAQRLKRAGYKNVQVINFGVPGYGVEQSYLLWKYLGQKYHLDYAVFLVFRHDVERDDTFGLPGYFALHARFVLGSGGLKLLPVAGRTPSEVVSDYYGFFPSWRYLRYDEREPIFFRVWSASLGSRFNPFYYRRDPGKELSEIYVRLFRDVAGHNRHLVICYSRHFDFIRDAVALKKLPNVHFVFMGPLYQRLMSGYSSLYLAPGGHRSALGNEATAEFLYDYLTGDKRPDVRAVVLGGQPRGSEAGRRDRPSGAYGSVELMIKNKPAAVFTRVNPKVALQTAVLNPKALGTRSFLMALSPGGEPHFAPLAFALKDGRAAVLSFAEGGKTVRVPVGVVRAPCGVVGSVEFYPSGERSGDEDWRISESDERRSLLVSSSVALQDLGLSVGGRALPCPIAGGLSGRSPDSWRWKIDCGAGVRGTVFFRSVARQILHLGGLPARGTLDLVGRSTQGGPFRCAMLGYKIERLDLPPFLSRMTAPLRK